MKTEEIDQKFAEASFIESATKPETVQIKISGSNWTYWRATFKDYDCGDPVGVGKSIQEAIDDFMETIQEKRAAKADPNDKNFVYEIPYKWS